MTGSHRFATQPWARPALRSGVDSGLRSRSGWREVEHPLLQQDGLQLLLQHARNVLTGTALIAAGLGPVQTLAGSLHLACLVSAAIGVLLLVLNLCSGWRELARRRESWAVRLGAVLAYVFVSGLLTQAMVELRGAL